MLCSLASKSLNKWGYNILKLMAISSWSSTKSRVNMRFVMKTSYLITMQPFSWHLKASISVIYPATKIQRLTALAATLALPADTNCQLTVATRHLFCPKHSLEVSEVHTTSTDFELGDWRFSIIDYVFARHITWWPQGSGVRLTKVYSILRWSNGKNAILPFIWWYTPSLPIQFRGRRSNQRGSWWHMWSSSTKFEAQGSITPTWLLLTDYDCRCSRICKKV